MRKTTEQAIEEHLVKQSGVWGKKCIQYLSDTAAGRWRRQRERKLDGYK